VKFRTADVDVTQLCNDTTRAAVHIATFISRPACRLGIRWCGHSVRL